MIIDVTTVTDDSATLHVTTSDGTVEVLQYDRLESDSDITVDVPVDGTDGTATFRTLPRPSGQLRCRFATVNDVHFGEVVAGRIENHTDGPIRQSAPGDDPYPEVMNTAAADEMAAIDPAAVIVKGDLSVDGRPEEWAAFEACYRTPFGERLHVVRGNHDRYHDQDEYAGDQRIDLPGVTVALLDTTISGQTTGDFTEAQSEWLDDVAASATNPVIAMGHHQQWVPATDSPKRSDDYFGLHPDGSERLDAVAQRRPALVAYSAGHTHRHRVRTMTASGIPSIEVGCTKDFPGTWAEYRVYDGGIQQIVHRMSSPAALAWSESCRVLYSDFGVDYETYALGELSDRCFVISPR